MLLLPIRENIDITIFTVFTEFFISRGKDCRFAARFYQISQLAAAARPVLDGTTLSGWSAPPPSLQTGKIEKLVICD